MLNYLNKNSKERTFILTSYARLHLKYNYFAKLGFSDYYTSFKSGDFKVKTDWFKFLRKNCSCGLTEVLGL
jgi:hypothetical protein